jgi:phage tail protein X
MFIVPFIHKVVTQNNLQINVFKVLTIGGSELWEEENGLNIDKDILNPNDIYVIANKGDRYDILANQYYSDSSLWWVISTANNNVIQNSLYLPEGTQIRIPSDVTLAIDNFEVINS